MAKRVSPKTSVSVCRTSGTICVEPETVRGAPSCLAAHRALLSTQDSTRRTSTPSSATAGFCGSSTAWSKRAHAPERSSSSVKGCSRRAARFTCSGPASSKDPRTRVSVTPPSWPDVSDGGR